MDDLAVKGNLAGASDSCVMETAPAPPLRRGFARWLFRMFLVAGGLSFLITAFELFQSWFYGRTHIAQSPVEGAVFVLIHILALIFLLMTMAWVARGL